MSYQAKVTVDNEYPVRYRATPDGEVLGKLKRGTIVEVIDDGIPDWYKIKYQDITAYMMSKYLTPVAEAQEVSKEDLKKIYNELKALLKDIESIIN